jgi:hypothetical protein
MGFFGRTFSRTSSEGLVFDGISEGDLQNRINQEARDSYLAERQAGMPVLLILQTGKNACPPALQFCCGILVILLRLARRLGQFLYAMIFVTGIWKVEKWYIC